jgi:cytochrome c-type biogenesis protein CcmF
MYGENIAIALVRLVARNRRRYGGYIVHAGIVILFAAFAGMAFKQEHDVTLRDGESFTTKDPYGREWTFTSEGISQFKVLNREVVAVSLQASMEGQPQRVLSSEKRQHFDTQGNPQFQQSTEVDILSSARQDVYLVFAGAVGDRADVRINFNPLVACVWWGGILMAIGGLIVMWPQEERKRQGGYMAELVPSVRAVPAEVP